MTAWELNSEFQHPLLMRLLNVSRNPILITDRFTMEILFANQASRDLLGKDFANRSIDDEFRSVLKPIMIDGRSIVEHSLHPAFQLRRDGVLKSELKWSTVKGMRDLNVVATTLDDAVDGRYLSIVQITDVSETKNVSRRVVSELSHEVRNSMGVILGFSELLEETQLESGSREALEVIKKNAQHVVHLVEEKLTSAKELEQHESKYSVFDVAELCQEVAHSMSILAEKRKNKIEVAVENHAMTAFADPIATRQIITNLLANAIKFTESGMIKIALCGSDAKLDHMSLEVTDSGTGIESSLVQTLFKPFSQAHHEAKWRNQGTGLGLHIVKTLASEMGGDVYLDRTQAGTGSTFVFRIPKTASCVGRGR